MEPIAGKRVLSNGVRTVDFYYDGEPGFPAPDRLITMAAFGRWLERTGLCPQRIYGTHDRGVATMAHVRRAMREAEEAGVTSR